MKIMAVETFDLQLPASERERALGAITTTGVTRVRTDAGITGYAFHGVGAAGAAMTDTIAPVLVGQDPLAIEQHLQRDPSLLEWPAVEHALWDIAGKAAGLPVSKLLGGARERIPVYLTCVWPGADDQSDVPPERQVDDIARYVAHGFTAIKYRVWRPNPLDDVAVAQAVRQRVGGRETVELMLDRTAQAPGTVWDYETAYRVARAFEQADGTWLEECFDRSDVETPGAAGRRRRHSDHRRRRGPRLGPVRPLPRPPAPSILCSRMPTTVAASSPCGRLARWPRASVFPVFHMVRTALAWPAGCKSSARSPTAACWSWLSRCRRCCPGSNGRRWRSYSTANRRSTLRARSLRFPKAPASAWK